MNKKILIEMEPAQFKAIIKEALFDFGLVPPPRDVPTYTINQVRQRLKVSHHTVKKLITTGHIRTTKSGRITEEALEEYLQNI